MIIALYTLIMVFVFRCCFICLYNLPNALSTFASLLSMSCPSWHLIFWNTLYIYPVSITVYIYLYMHIKRSLLVQYEKSRYFKVNRSTRDFKFCIYVFCLFIVIPSTSATRVSNILVLFRHLDCWLCICINCTSNKYLNRQFASNSLVLSV